MTEIKVFENGRISEGWQPMDISQNPRAGEVYFRFESSQHYLTAPNDTLEIELHVVKDLDGIGALHTGVLPAGIYKAQGTYSLIVDEYRVPDAFKSVPAETIEQLKKTMEFKAFLESWQPQWPLQITGDEGWLDPPQRQQVERMLETMKSQQ